MRRVRLRWHSKMASVCIAGINRGSGIALRSRFGHAMTVLVIQSFPKACSMQSLVATTGRISDATFTARQDCGPLEVRILPLGCQIGGPKIVLAGLRLVAPPVADTS